MDAKRRLQLINISLSIIIVGIIVVALGFNKISLFTRRRDQLQPASKPQAGLETAAGGEKPLLQYERPLGKESLLSPLPKDLKEAYQGYQEQDLEKNIFGEEMKAERVIRLRELDKAIADSEQELSGEPENKQIQNKLKLFRHLKSITSGDFDARRLEENRNQ